MNFIKITRPDGTIHFAPEGILDILEGHNQNRPQNDKHSFEVITEEKMTEMIVNKELFDENVAAPGQSQLKAAKEELGEKEKTIEELKKQIEEMALALTKVEAAKEELGEKEKTIEVDSTAKTEAKKTGK